MVFGSEGIGADSPSRSLRERYRDGSKVGKWGYPCGSEGGGHGLAFVLIEEF